MRALLGIVLLLCVGSASAQIIPGTCGQYEKALTAAVYNRLSPAASVPAFAAQMMQESSCNSLAKSSAGAMGLDQFMPDTAKWMAQLSNDLAPADPMNPQWAIKAQVTYMAWLMRRDRGKTECDTYAFALSSYNGGEGWLYRDQTEANLLGYNPSVWFDNVEIAADPRRSPASRNENRAYPQRILKVLMPLFVAAGWGRVITCDVE